MPNYTVKASANPDSTEITIYGDIGTDYWYPEESNDAKTLVPQIDAITTPNITLRINSYGGSVVDGLAIYNALKRHSATITGCVDGVAMSAAADILMACDTIKIAANGLLMIHASSSWASGNATNLRAAADMLEKYDEARCSNYVAKTGKSLDEIKALMSDGQDHFFTAEEAIAQGFADQIEGQAIDISASAPTLKQRYQQLPAAWLKAAQQPKPKETTMATATATPETPPQETEAPPNPVSATTTHQPTAAANDSEKQRQSEITALFSLVPEDKKAIHAMKPALLINNTITVDAARQQILAKLGEGSAPVMHNVVMGEEGKDKFINDAVNGMLMKVGVEKPVAGNKFRGMPLARIAEECLIYAGSQYGFDRREMVAAAFTQTTSDFPVILENVMHKTLLNAYRTAPNTWKRWCKSGTVSDLRPHNRYRTGSIGNLDNITEAGEFKYKTIPDGEKESVQATSKGNLIRITREMIINDDMGAFTGISADIGKAGARTIEAGVYVYLATNPTLSDGVALFHNTHKNVMTTAAPTMQAVEDGRVLMAAQTGVGGVDILDIRPTLWLGGHKYGGTVRGINRSAYDPDTANKLQKPNIVQNLFTDVIDTARITGNSWYMFADPNEAPVIEVVFLDGNEEPIVEMQASWTNAGAEYRAILDFGIAAIDFRGAAYNAGA